MLKKQIFLLMILLQLD
ncbi:hypothetical protein IFM89_002849 [Coptis chinensis]|uniref:Uncharacterized protein n=1 Tax=Coptis chinensis TaxID=261450 RepID=A0A835H1A2_9MAGN|nr:hypothetical protein IFM89_002849 [Coptis chinensis]